MNWLTNPLVVQLAWYLAGSIVLTVGLSIRAKIAASHLTDQEKTLADAVVDVAGQVLTAFKVQSGGKLPTANDLPQLGKTALVVLQASRPTLVQDAEAVGVQLLHQVAVQSGNHALVTESGLSLNAPALVPVGGGK